MSDGFSCGSDQNGKPISWSIPFGSLNSKYLILYLLGLYCKSGNYLNDDQTYLVEKNDGSHIVIELTSDEFLRLLKVKYNKDSLFNLEMWLERLKRIKRKEKLEHIEKSLK